MNHIILVGMPGSGKSSLGKKVARKLGRLFIDTDEELIKIYEKTIAQMFDSEGELFFRRAEEYTFLQVLNRSEKRVITTGGGLPVFFHNSEYLLKAGICVYLKCKPETLTRRLMADAARPMFAGKSEEQIRTKVEELILQREYYYSQAHITLPADTLNARTPDELIFRVKNLADVKRESYF